jgi:signal transduction histidine kinase
MKTARMFWPQSLYWQMIGAVAIGVLCIQGISAAYQYYGESTSALSQAAFILRERIASTAERLEERGKDRGSNGWDREARSQKKRRNAQIAIMITPKELAIDGFAQDASLTADAARLLAYSGEGIQNVTVSVGPASALPKPLSDAPMQSRFVKRLRNQNADLPNKAVLLTGQITDGRWISSAALVRPVSRWLILGLILRTLAICAAVMIPLALVARRIIRPLERLTQRAKGFGITGETGPIEVTGSADIRNLIHSFNEMQARVTVLLGEKDVMLGAIGHDLKTPLASLRVRVESVGDDAERTKMAATIDEMVTILDDILTLARLGNSGESQQKTDMAALLETVIDDFLELDAPVSFDPPALRIIANVRPVLLRRALRNVIGNAVKHGGGAAISVQQIGGNVHMYIDDNGPGIPYERIEAMFCAFARADASRNRATGGSGLGLTIARAIARSHGGDVTLSNRTGGGLRAAITLSTDAGS